MGPILWFLAFKMRPAPQLHYKRNLPLHLRNLCSLKEMHTDVYSKFMEGHFVGHKSCRAFSGLATDQLHEQLIRILKGDGGIIGLTDYDDSLRQFMILALELSRLVKEFEDGEPGTDKKHHEQYPSFQRAFADDGKGLISSFKDFGNPFNEDRGHLFALDTGKIMSNDVVNAVRNIKQLGAEQYEEFYSERLTNQKLLFDATIPNLQLPLMSYNVKPKANSEIKALKQERTQYLQMLISAGSGQKNISRYAAAIFPRPWQHRL